MKIKKYIKNNTIDIQSAKKGQIIRLNDVNFATNSFLLNSTTMSIIDELKAYLQAKPTMKIAIYGQYYKPEDKIYLEELLNVLKIHKIQYVIEHHYYTGLKKDISIANAEIFSSGICLNKILWETVNLLSSPA